MNRVEILKNIDKIIADKCENCQTKKDIAKTDNRNFSNVNTYCTKTCGVGQEIQSLGKLLLRR